MHFDAEEIEWPYNVPFQFLYSFSKSKNVESYLLDPEKKVKRYDENPCALSFIEIHIIGSFR